MNANDKQNPLWQYVFAGISFFILAHVIVNMLMFIVNRVYGLPVNINYYDVRMYCQEVAALEKMSPGKTGTFFHNSWVVILTLFVVVGFIVLRWSINNLARWVGVLLMCVPLYQCGKIYAGRLFISLIHDRNISEAFSPLLSYKLLILSVVAILTAVYVYVTCFSRQQRKLLWIVALPAFMTTFYLWMFIVGKYILPFG